MHSFQFDSEQAINNIIFRAQYFEQFQNKRFFDSSLELVKSGAVYVFGRDENFHPNLIFEMQKFLNFTNDLEAIKKSIFYLSIIIIENMMVPNIIERMNLLINFSIFENCEFFF